ncbi:hypothetical protein ACFQ0M_37235 [Kitasatospora aburaviensis]
MHRFPPLRRRWRAGGPLGAPGSIVRGTAELGECDRECDREYGGNRSDHLYARGHATDSRRHHAGRRRARPGACGRLSGALRLHTADDGALARVRLPGGLLTERQALALAEAATALGDGGLEVTSRGNVQLRGLAAGCGAELGARLRAVGLLPSDTHERVRNIVASPAPAPATPTCGPGRASWTRSSVRARGRPDCPASSCSSWTTGAGTWPR